MSQAILTVVNTDVESGRDDTTLVQSTVELDDNLAASVVVDDLELADVTWKMNGISVCSKHPQTSMTEPRRDVMCSPNQPPRLVPPGRGGLDGSQEGLV